MGDSIDNVPGVAGIGPKTAVRADQQVRLAGRAAGGGGGGRRAGQARRRDRRSARRDARLARAGAPARRRAAAQVARGAAPDRSRQEAAARAVHGARVLAPGRPAVGVGRGGDRAARREHARRRVRRCPRRSRRSRRRRRSPPVTKRAELEALAADIRAAGAVGLAALYDGPSAVRSDLVGLGVRVRRAPRLPAALPPLPGRAQPASPRRRRWRCWRRCWRRREIAKHVHDAKTLEVLLLRRGLTLGGRRVGLDAGGVPAGRVAHALRPGRRQRRPRAIPPIAGRGSWMGTGASATPGRRDISVEEVGARLGAEAAAALALAAPQAAKLAAAGLDGLYRDMELPLAHVLAHIECRGIQLDTDRLREIGLEVGTQLAALETEIHALAGMPFNINSPKQLADVLFGKLSLPVVRKTKTGPSTDADTLEELAALHPVPAKIVDYRVLVEAEGDVHRRAAGAGEPRDRAAAHVVQPGGRGDRAAVVQQPEPPEHPDPQRGRPAHPPGVRRQARARAGVGRLLADRAADPRALLAGSGVPGRLPRGRGHPPAHGGRGVRRARRRR